MREIKIGDRVRFKQEWQDEGDGDVLFVAVEDQVERKCGTLHVSTVAVRAELGLFINPIQVVDAEMIQCVY
jgi:hypothetical protein